jgi:hypothetical protein
VATERVTLVLEHVCRVDREAKPGHGAGTLLKRVDVAAG